MTHYALQPRLVRPATLRTVGLVLFLVYGLLGGALGVKAAVTAPDFTCSQDGNDITCSCEAHVAPGTSSRLFIQPNTAAPTWDNSVYPWNFWNYSGAQSRLVDEHPYIAETPYSNETPYSVLEGTHIYFFCSVYDANQEYDALHYYDVAYNGTLNVSEDENYAEPPPEDVCGDGEITGEEECDDGDTDNGDGCSSSCAVESGWACEGEPSVCMEGVCGDSIIGGPETCDDGNTAASDGCSAACQTEEQWQCVNEPSVCIRNNYAGEPFSAAATVAQLAPLLLIGLFLLIVLL